MPPRWPFGFGKRPALVDVQPFGESHGGWCSRVSNGNERGKIPKVSQQSLTKKRVCCSLHGCWARLRPPMKREAYYHGRYTQTCTRDWWKKISSLASSHRHNTQRYITHSRVSANSFCSSGSLSFILSNSVQVEATCASAELWTCVRLSVSVWPGSSESRAWSCRLGHCALSALQSNAALLFFSHPKCFTQMNIVCKRDMNGVSVFPHAEQFMRLLRWNVIATVVAWIHSGGYFSHYLRYPQYTL